MAIFDSLKNVVNNVINQTKNNSNDTNEKCIFCVKCGRKLPVDAKFCSSCGEAVNGNNNSISTIPAQSNSNTRQQEYVGTVYKCSNCGCVITKTTAICPECGMKITGQTSVNSVQEFKEQLMAIELNRSEFNVANFFQRVSPVDMQKLSLIKSFPIPNSIDDILEFMLLAVANIDVNLSKNTWGNKLSNGGVETKETIKKSLSDAWVLKMQQAYQKAEIMFPNDPLFKQIQKIYFDKMKELKIKI